MKEINSPNTRIFNYVCSPKTSGISYFCYINMEKLSSFQDNWVYIPSEMIEIKAIKCQRMNTQVLTSAQSHLASAHLTDTWFLSCHNGKQYSSALHFSLFALFYQTWYHCNMGCKAPNHIASVTAYRCGMAEPISAIGTWQKHPETSKGTCSLCAMTLRKGT